MRRLIGAIALTAVGWAAAAAQGPALHMDAVVSSLIVQPSYGSLSHWFSTASRSVDGFPAPAIPVVLTDAERSYVNSGGDEYTVQPCAGEPFFVYQPSTPIPYWAWRSLFGPDAGMWPPSRVDGMPYGYYASTSEYRTTTFASGYYARSYSVYRSVPFTTGYVSYPTWYPWSSWYPTNAWYRGGGWSGGDYREWTRSTYEVSTYRSYSGSYYAPFIYSWSRFGYRPFRPRLMPDPVIGSWRLPDGPCYTRDPRGQVIVIQ
jgi:hypothetical protein